MDMVIKYEPVDVYWNLHKKVYSFRSRRSGLVINHVDEAILLGPVMPVVQVAGLARTLKEGRKNVHAFLRTEAWALNTGSFDIDGVEITYNPRKEGKWVTREGREPVGEIAYAKLTIEDGCPKVIAVKY